MAKISARGAQKVCQVKAVKSDGLTGEVRLTVTATSDGRVLRQVRIAGSTSRSNNKVVGNIKSGTDIDKIETILWSLAQRWGYDVTDMVRY